MLDVDEYERATAEEAFKSPWCIRAIDENRDLHYLADAPQPIPVRKPPECAPQEMNEFGKHKTCEFVIRVT